MNCRGTRQVLALVACLALLATVPASADSPIALKVGATTTQTEPESLGMTLSGSLSGPRWRPFSKLVLAPQLEFLLARRHTGLVLEAGASSYTRDYFEIPLLLRAELMLGSRSLYAMAGGYGSLLLRADETNAEGLMRPANMARRYDLGLLAAAGLTLVSSPWGELFAELRYQRGYVGVLRESEHKQQAVSLLVGYGLGTNATSTPDASGRDRRLTLKGGLVATRFQSPGASASTYVPGFAFGGTFSPLRFGSWIALIPQLELAFVHRGEHHGVMLAGSLTLDDVEASAQVRAEVGGADLALYGVAGFHGSLVVRAQQNLEGAILSMRESVRPVNAGWLAGVGAEFATFGDATVSLEVRLQRSLISRFSASNDVALQAFMPATQESLFMVVGFRYGAPTAEPRRTLEDDPEVLHSANDQDDQRTQRSGRTVSVRIARLSDRWLKDLQFHKIESSHRDGIYGYQVIYTIPGWKDKDKKETRVLFWERGEIDFEDSNPLRYKHVHVPISDGRLVRPTRITSDSLPDVHRWILVIENDLQQQADGAIRAMEGFSVVAELGTGRYILRRTAARGSSSASVVSRRAARRRAAAKARGGALQGVWSKPPVLRGNAIEAALGRNLPVNFPVIDRFKKGVATSIKSLDLDAKTYQNTRKLASRLRGYIRKVAKFNGDDFGGTRISAYEIRARVLELAIPHRGSVAQQQVLRKLMEYARSVGVEMKVIVTP